MKQPGVGAGDDLLGHLYDGALDTPPETAPTTLPESLIAIFEPGGSGADLRVATTVATATRLPLEAHSSA